MDTISAVSPIIKSFTQPFAGGKEVVLVDISYVVYCLS
jgi:hypothetical protein